MFCYYFFLFVRTTGCCWFRWITFHEKRNEKVSQGKICFVANLIKLLSCCAYNWCSLGLENLNMEEPSDETTLLPEIKVQFSEFPCLLNDIKFQLCMWSLLCCCLSYYNVNYRQCLANMSAENYYNMFSKHSREFLITQTEKGWERERKHISYHLLIAMFRRSFQQFHS